MSRTLKYRWQRLASWSDELDVIQCCLDGNAIVSYRGKVGEMRVRDTYEALKLCRDEWYSDFIASVQSR